jgi:hypothetical protein
MNENFLYDIKNRGFFIFDFSENINLIDINKIKFEWEEKYNLRENVPINMLNEIKNMLNILHYEIDEKILKGNVKKSEISNNRMWEGFSEETDFWHNDIVDGPNLFFLLYFDDMTKTNDGALWVKNEKEEIRILPKSGTLVCLNQDNPNFLHKAEKSKFRRVVASFDFFVEW